MDKIRSIKNRLSISVDKLSSLRRSKSQPRKSEMVANVPCSVGDIPGSVRNSRADDRPSSAMEVSSAESSSRPTSYCEVDLDETLSDEYLAVKDVDVSIDSKSSPIQTVQDSASLTVEHKPLKVSTPTMQVDSLVTEVMKEFEKIGDLSEGSTQKKLKSDEPVEGATVTDVPTNTEATVRNDSNKNNDKSPLCDPGISKSEETLVAAEDVVQMEDGGEKEAKEDLLEPPDTCRTESLTSGYFSDIDATIPDRGCESTDLKSTPRLVENAEQNKSAFTSVIPESQNKSAFSTLTRDSQEDTPSTSPSAPSESKPESPKPSAFTQVTTEKPSIIAQPTATPSEKENKPYEPPCAASPPPEKKTKKESLYSRIKRKKDALTEPIYAKIKPKLTPETSFLPIEPIAGKNSSHDNSVSGLVKPEPVYSTASRSASAFTSPIRPTDVVTPTDDTKQSSGGKPGEPIYSKILPRASRSNTVPREAIYSTVKKNTASLPKELSQRKAREHIYNTPLPPTPREEAMMRREAFFSSSSSADYSKVTVRVGEISPKVPAIITINNPGYAAPIVPSSTSLPAPNNTTCEEPAASSTVSVVSASSAQDSSVSSLHTEEEDKNKISQSPLSKSPEHGVCSRDAERSKITQLVEELAQELEAESMKYDSEALTDYKTKKEILKKLLSTYDVPRNLRRVEEVDEEAAMETEQALVPASVSVDELRYVDDNEDNAETVYADVPDFSQDEFVIALDDENDPRYASLTRALRREKVSESPGRVSKRTATMYANALNVVTALRVLINSKSSRAATVINKMGTLARPYTQRMIHGNITDTSWIQRIIFHKSGHNGFDELRRYIKSGGEFCKELTTIMHERAELEASYAKGLYKLSSKLMKASRENSCTVTQAWQVVGAEMETQGDIHRSIASAIEDDVVQPLRQLIETQHKIRKGVESMVDKTTKNLHEWRAAESKAKKQCYSNCRENEKIQDMMLEARLGRGKTLTDKETVKVEKQRRKAEEAVQKSDQEYYMCCTRAERARLEWESAVFKGSSCFQTLEEERLQALRDLVFKYQKNAVESAPKIVASVDRLDEPVKACDVEKDIQAVITAKGTGENIPEQMLPDFYAEDMNNIMNRDRRRDALEKFLKMLRTDLERERRGKQGVENLAKALQETPTFGGEESQQDVNDKLQHMKAMLAYLEAARYKIQCSLDDLNNRPKTVHPLAKHIEMHRDKQGLTCSVLKVPPWVRGNSVDVSPASDSPTGSPIWNDRGTADGNSVQPESDFGNVEQLSPASRSSTLQHTVDLEVPPTPPTRARNSTISSARLTQTDKETPSMHKPQRSSGVFMSAPRYPSLMLVTDEFSSQGSDRDYQVAVNDENTEPNTKDVPYYAHPLPAAGAGGRCKALYDYESNMYDELTIRTGDIINIHEKQADGWWVGELDNVVGIFPATYVEEID